MVHASNPASARRFVGAALTLLLAGGATSLHGATALAAAPSATQQSSPTESKSRPATSDAKGGVKPGEHRARTSKPKPSKKASSTEGSTGAQKMPAAKGDGGKVADTSRADRSRAEKVRAEKDEAQGASTEKSRAIKKADGAGNSARPTVVEKTQDTKAGAKKMTSVEKADDAKDSAKSAKDSTKRTTAAKASTGKQGDEEATAEKGAVSKAGHEKANAKKATPGKTDDDRPGSQKATAEKSATASSSASEAGSRSTDRGRRGKKIAARIGGSKRREDKVAKPIPKPCLGVPVQIDRGGEVERITLVNCAGKPRAEARRQLSILARPWGTPRPASLEEPDAKTPPAPGKRALPPGEIAPGVRLVDPGLLVRIDALARRYPDRQISLVSGYRPRSQGSLHQTARALDLRIAGVSNQDLVAACRTLQDTGCGYYPNSSFTHVDVRSPGTGVVYWIDASGPGETPRYVASWPPPSHEVTPTSDAKPGKEKSESGSGGKGPVETAEKADTEEKKETDASTEKGPAQGTDKAAESPARAKASKGPERAAEGVAEKPGARERKEPPAILKDDVEVDDRDGDRASKSPASPPAPRRETRTEEDT
ncbi:uncharacterized protein CMC5_072320 [Chondromyces crocatus]|uniref:DUF882 domain-containing protein n=2 Tax=Chondromyces crocatus TaxID=52 RepID=A0A0K1EQ02_CHOCO|nr:uncharacterized protein CMC5_072320 [Chondromyces crocatus]